MASKVYTKLDEMQIQGLIDQYLQTRVSNCEASHLDEDTLSAFIEGSLGEFDSPRIVGHLVDCGYCLRITSELVSLNAALAEEEVSVPLEASQPTRISDILSGIMSRIFGASDGAVFAHHEVDEKDSVDSDDEKEA